MKGDKVARPSGKSTVPFPYYCTGVFASAESEAIENPRPKYIYN